MTDISPDGAHQTTPAGYPNGLFFALRGMIAILRTHFTENGKFF